jgi:hypothetical protein
MKFNEPWLKVFGDTTYRGNCPQESAEQITFFRKLRDEYPDTWGRLAVHPKNEGKRSGAQFQQLAMDKAMGLQPGASDIVIPMGFCCEMKRKNHMLSKWQPGQLDYLKAVHEAGGFACVALGWKGAWEALQTWLDQTKT